MQKQFDELDTFVNSNKANYNAKPSQSLEAAADEFCTLFLYDTECTVAWPVLVYSLNGEYIAWYDCENYCGFIAKQLA